MQPGRRWLHCQAAAPRFGALQIDGGSGHRIAFEDSVVHAIVTPCSANSTNITVQLIRKVGLDKRGRNRSVVGPRLLAGLGPISCCHLPPACLQIVGEGGAELLGESGYIVGPPWLRREPIVDTLTKQEGAYQWSCDCTPAASGMLSVQHAVQHARLPTLQPSPDPLLAVGSGLYYLSNTVRVVPANDWC